MKDSAARQAVALAAAGQIGEALTLLDEAGGRATARRCSHGACGGSTGAANSRSCGRTRGFQARRGGGIPAAARVHAGFLAAGVGGERDWARAFTALAASGDPLMERQARLIAAMDLDELGNPASIPAGEPLSETPSISLFRTLFSPEECALLVELAEARLKPALIFHEGQRRFVADPLRDSDAAGFPIVLEWPFVHALNRRIAAASGTDVSQGEPLQVLRYAPGQQYRPHLDAVPGMANQRILTALAWLNADYEGGETLFLESGLMAKGGQGDLMVFANALPDGRPDPATRHAGAPVTRGVKLLASRWIRARGAGPEGFGAHEAEG